MKFHDLSIGQRFELDGEAYVKTSPVLAGKADGGGTRFMARYVMVKLLDGEAPRAKVAQEKMLRAEAVLAAFEAYHARCRELVEDGGSCRPAAGDRRCSGGRAARLS